jgi:ATP-dependent DNA helicase RecG
MIEKWGSGIRRMRTECEESGLPTPILEEIATQFRVTLFTVAKRTPKLSESDEEIVDWLRKVAGASTRQVATQFSMSLRSARLRLAALSARGTLAEIGSSPTDPQRRYVVPKSDYPTKRK